MVRCGADVWSTMSPDSIWSHGHTDGHALRILMLLHFDVQDSPESGYMVRQKLGEWQARYTSMIINGTARRSCNVSCSAVALPGASQTYHTTLSQLPKGLDYAACVGCVMRILTLPWPHGEFSSFPMEMRIPSLLPTWCSWWSNWQHE